ncbi:MAG TPA: hypothetical protein VFK05_11545, partial [Polyangiaceae bacterium]|nr:hypothetical protein [Polyangiaceae bacterium]
PANFADGGPLSAEQCAAVCTDGENVVTCVRKSAESVLCLNEPFPCEGRRPAGLRGPGQRSHNAFARHLADAAWLEAASIVAFRELRSELRSHRAPRRLLRALSRSARDERRHARASKALARRFGVPVAPVQSEPLAPRSLLEIALENAVEGCVRETWGALIALHQAERASEPWVRANMSRIAPDEVRHAELAWAIDRWLTPRLTPTEREQVRAARAGALSELQRDAQVVPDSDVCLRLGLPGVEESRVLLEAFAKTLPLSTV